jgi:hypothetical protein
MFDWDAQMVVRRVTYRLLRSLGDPNRIEVAVSAILPSVTSLSAKLILITDVGYRPGAGHKLVSEAAAAEFERNWRSEVRATPTSDLRRERDLAAVLIVAKRGAAASEAPFETPEAPELTLGILRSARTEVRSQSTNSRAVHRSPRLEWDALVELFGGEDKLRHRIDRLKETKPQGEDELLDLAERYLAGWRPGHHRED